jgi:hypothetical protein
MAECHWFFFLQEILFPKMKSGSALGMDQLAVHINAETRQMLAARGITPLYMYSKTSPEVSPLDAGFFKVFKDYFRGGMDRMPIGERSLANLGPVVKVALEAAAPSIKGFFAVCGYTGDHPRSSPAKLRAIASTTLPYDPIPVGARLTRAQRSRDSFAPIRRGRPSKPAPAPPPGAPGNGRARAVRFEAGQIALMEAERAHGAFPARDAIDGFARAFRTTPRRVARWFADRRRRRPRAAGAPL